MTFLPYKQLLKKSLCTMNRNGLHPPPGQRLLPRLPPLVSPRWPDCPASGTGRMHEPRVLPGGLRPRLPGQGSESVSPSLGQLHSSGFSLGHLQPREPPLSPLQPAGWEGQSRSTFGPQPCPALQDVAQSVSPPALKISGGGQGGLPHVAVGRMAWLPPWPCPFTRTQRGPLPSLPLWAQHLPGPGPSTSRTYFPRPLTPPVVN